MNYVLFRSTSRDTYSVSKTSGSIRGALICDHCRGIVDPTGPIDVVVQERTAGRTGLRCSFGVDVGFASTRFIQSLPHDLATLRETLLDRKPPPAAKRIIIGAMSYRMRAFDMVPDQTYASVVHPRLSFGSGQRYAAKGCHIVGVGPGTAPALTALSPWVIQ